MSKDRARIAALGQSVNAHAKSSPRRRALVWLLASAMVALGTADASSTPGHKHVPPQRSKTAKAEESQAQIGARRKAFGTCGAEDPVSERSNACTSSAAVAGLCRDEAGD